MPSRPIAGVPNDGRRSTKKFRSSDLRNCAESVIITTLLSSTEMIMNPKTKNLAVSVRSDTYEKIGKLADSLGIPRSQFVALAVDQYVLLHSTPRKETRCSHGTDGQHEE